MTRLRILPFILLLSLSGCSITPIFNVNKGLLVENAIIISTNDEGRIKKFTGYVLVENDTIVYSGVEKPRITGTLKTINGIGKYIIPGLIDSHVHLANVAGMKWSQQKANPKLVNSYLTQLPKSFLYYGYTTLIDLNNYAPDVLEKINDQLIKPDIYNCGQQIQVMNDFMMIMEELPIKDRLAYPFLFDKYNKNVKIPDSINLELHSPISIVNNIINKQQGVGAKIAYEDESSGFPQFWELPSLNLLKDLKKETQKAGIPIIMHAPSYEGHKLGVNAGIDIFAHSMWNWHKTPEQFLDTEFTQTYKNLLKEIAAKRIGYQLTYRTIQGEVDLLKGDFTTNPSLTKVLPKDYLEWINTEQGKWGKQQILNRANIVKAINPTLYSHLRQQFESDEAMFKHIQQVLITRMNLVAKYLSDNYANLLFGTDNGAMNMVTNPPGYNGFLEMKHWYEAGITLEKIFIAATFNNAKAFNMNDRYGTIEKGKIANLVLLNENPLKSISAYDQINSVIIHGKVYSRDTLSASFVN
jgi:imidazolonepropionase-like amidohydrolase